MIRRARSEDAGEVSALAVQSKAAWGYDRRHMEVFRAELTLTGDQLFERQAHVAESSGHVVGFYTLVPVSGAEMELDHLFVDPALMRRGIGSVLMTHAITRCREMGVAELKIISDPNAVGFYEAHGATIVGEHRAAIPGRVIPVLKLRISGGMET